MQLIPALDLLGDQAVRLERGDYDRVIFTREWREHLDALLGLEPDLIHVVDLTGARDGVARLDLVAELVARSSPTPVQFSGGLRSIGTARAVLDGGVARVIVGTAVWEEPDALGRFVEALADRLVVALDVRDGLVALRGWTTSAPISVDAALQRCRAAGVTRLHVTAIDRDGTMGGPDLDLYRSVCAAGIPVVAAGGVRDEEDLAALEAVGCEGAVMGVGLLHRLSPGLLDP